MLSNVISLEYCGRVMHELARRFTDFPQKVSEEGFTKNETIEIKKVTNLYYNFFSSFSFLSHFFFFFFFEYCYG